MGELSQWQCGSMMCFIREWHTGWKCAGGIWLAGLALISVKDGGVNQLCLLEGEFVQTLSPSFAPPCPAFLPHPPSGVNEVRDHITDV